MCTIQTISHYVVTTHSLSLTDCLTAGYYTSPSRAVSQRDQHQDTNIACTLLEAENGHIIATELLRKVSEIGSEISASSLLSDGG